MSEQKTLFLYISTELKKRIEEHVKLKRDMLGRPYTKTELIITAIQKELDKADRAAQAIRDDEYSRSRKEYHDNGHEEDFDKWPSGPEKAV